MCENQTAPKYALGLPLSEDIFPSTGPALVVHFVVMLQNVTLSKPVNRSKAFAVDSSTPVVCVVSS